MAFDSEPRTRLGTYWQTLPTVIVQMIVREYFNSTRPNMLAYCASAKEPKAQQWKQDLLSILHINDVSCEILMDVMQ